MRLRAAAWKAMPAMAVLPGLLTLPLAAGRAAEPTRPGSASPMVPAAGSPLAPAASPMVPAAPTLPPAGDLDHSLDAPPPPPRLVARSFLVGGGALLLGGFVGAVVTPHCATRDARGGCVDPQGAPAIFPILIVAGVALGAVGSYLYRQDAPP